ncbi:MAG TPA: glycoside hydrolase family 16 protein [Pyrinomonadaceae bacterium]|nr:glycoside hydrolase family 16 protein [Pyrinomonadaceae bacterium]
MPYQRLTESFNYRPRPTRALLCLVAFFSLAAAGSQANAQTTWTLVWGDEFNGSAGAAVDGTKWVMETGGGGWGNNELEYYTNSTRNAAMDGTGNLVITAIQETLARKFRCWYGQCQYTSARLKTQGKFNQAYGRFEARIKVPYGQGIWPAFWMLGNNIQKAGWPNCGEIDIMENIGREPAIVHGTIHGPGYSGANGIGSGYSLQSGAFSDTFHVFAVEWEPNVIRWYVDGALYQTRTPADLPAGASWVFDHPFFMILNLAVGGYWPGNPEATTMFPQKMYVDYVRVYRKTA